MRGGDRLRELAWTGPGDACAVAGALARLDGEARLVLALLFVEGLNEAEAAAVIDQPVERVRHLAGAAQRALAASAAPAVRRAA